VRSVRITGPEGRVVQGREAGPYTPRTGTAWAVSGRSKLSIERRRP
jgi:hypothetical protein